MRRLALALFLAAAAARPLSAQEPADPPEYAAFVRAYQARDWARAVAVLEQLVATGHAKSFTDLGWMYEHGLGVQQDWVRASRFYREGGERGNVIGASNYAYALFNGLGVVADTAEAARRFALAAAAGNPRAMHWTGWLHEMGYGVPKDMKRAVAWYEKAGNAGNTGSAVFAGNAYRFGYGGTPKDAARALMWYEKAAAQGDTTAARLVAAMRAEATVAAAPAVVAKAPFTALPQIAPSLGGSADTAEAVRRFREGAARGDAESMAWLGWAYDHGAGGVARDTAQAFHYYATSAERGSAAGARNLAANYANGRGVTKNPWAAMAMYELAAWRGDTAAARHAATTELPASGGGPEYDEARRAKDFKGDKVGALELFRRAMNKGHRGGTVAIQDAYQNGVGVAKDSLLAKHYLRVCASMEAHSCQTLLGMWLEGGLAGVADAEGARVMYERAALQKNTLGMFRLAEMYDQGRGIPRNDALATHWYWTAYAHKSVKAEYLLKARGLLQPDPRTQAYIDYIHANGPSRKDAASFAYEVAVYCKLGGPKCHEYSVAANRFEKERNSAAESANIARIWNVYAAPAGTQTDEQWRARSECMRRKTESIQRQTYGQQDWAFTGSC